ncbi:MAG: DUF58 domain-containing protein [Actinobacteria bacterium]|nr:DUF58 domain-containing protein [Actinomycetota bacterium]
MSLPTSPRTRQRILSPELVARLVRFRLLAKRRVQGRYAGAHASRRYGASLDFADYREYVRGDDPRRIDLAAYQRLGRLLVKLYEAEDEAAVRIVVDLSASMGFGRKADVAREVTAAFAALAAAGQDRVRVLLAGAVPTSPTGSLHRGGSPETEQLDANSSGAGAGVDAGPWFRGPNALPAVEHRLLGVRPPAPAGAGGEPPGRADLVTAVRRARGEGPVGPVVLVSDLLFEGVDDVLRALASGRGDALVVHVVGREDLDPSDRGDLRLVDAETGQDVEVGIAEDVLDAYAAARDAWLDEVEAGCGRQGISYARVVDDASVEDLVLTTLRALGVVA